MIIACKCGKYEFEVSKNEIPKEGRNVQWEFVMRHGFKRLMRKKNKITEVSKPSFSFIKTAFYLLLFILTAVGIMNILKEFLITNFPENHRLSILCSISLNKLTKIFQIYWFFSASNIKLSTSFGTSARVIL